MHEGAKLLDALRGITPIAYPERHLFRSIDLAALMANGIENIQPLFDLGPATFGQRFSPKGGARALYVAEHPFTSYLEATNTLDAVSDLSQKPVVTQTTLHYVLCSRQF